MWCGQNLLQSSYPVRVVYEILWTNDCLHEKNSPPKFASVCALCCKYLWFENSFNRFFWPVWYMLLNVIYVISSLSGFPQVLCPGKSWIILGFVNFYEKSWKSPGMLHNICPTHFVFQVVCNEFLPSWYVRYSTSFFLVYLPVSRIKI